MKHLVPAIYLTIGLASCGGPIGNSVNPAPTDSTRSEKQADAEGTNTLPLPAESTNEKTSVDSGFAAWEDSLFINLELEPKEITKALFEKYEKSYNANCVTDSGGFIQGYGLSVAGHCDEICQDFLIEEKSGKRMLLPCNYDAGISGLVFSPSCNQFLVYSSYDGPDYSNYYSARAEIIGFKLSSEKGLKGIKPSFKCFSQDWSIEDLIWINENSVALKIYEEARTGDGSGLHYKYFKASLRR